MRSLRTRLLAGTLAAVSAIWILLVFGAWHEARKEAEELFDAHLAQTTVLIAGLVGDDAEEIAEHLPAHRYARTVAFQVWAGDRLLARSAGAPTERLSDVEEGYSDAQSGGRQWRVYSRRDERHRHLVQVAEALEARRAVGRELATHLLRPLAVALPLLALALWLFIRASLAPLARLAESIGARSPQRLDPIALAAAPRELHPILAQLNRLLGRVGSSLAQERRFTADAAHELRTPLAALRTHAQVAQRSRSAPERDLALQRVLEAVDRATRLVEQLLMLARLDATSLAEGFAPCELRSLAAEALAEVAPLALARSVELVLAESPALTVTGERSLLVALLRNLVDNAVRYGPPGSRVEVAATRGIAGAQIEILDQGPGIPAQERERVLERFYRIAGSGAEGSGLGLSIVRRIAELHGARLELADHPAGTGLCARVLFPQTNPLPPNSA